jgi:hypothetical protein
VLILYEFSPLLKLNKIRRNISSQLLDSDERDAFVAPRRFQFDTGI